MRAPNLSQSVDPETNGSLRKDQLAGFDLLRRWDRHSHYIIGNDSFNGINTASLSASRMPFYLINCTDLRRSRSEEHTSELQSLMRNSYAVFCLKKKTNNKK